METTVRQIPLGVVDRVEPILRKYAASTADQEALVVRVERVVLLEMENEAWHADGDAEDPGKARSRKEERGVPEASSDQGSKENDDDDDNPEEVSYPRAGFLRGLSFWRIPVDAQVRWGRMS
jgi:hypothetical protein